MFYNSFLNSNVIYRRTEVNLHAIKRNLLLIISGVKTKFISVTDVFIKNNGFTRM